MKVGELISVLKELEDTAQVGIALDYKTQDDMGVHPIVQIDKFEMDNGDVTVVFIVEVDETDGETLKLNVPPAANKN